MRFLLCKVHRPDTSTSAQVKHSLGVTLERREEQFAFKHHTIEVMNEIHPILLFLIVRLRNRT